MNNVVQRTAERIAAAGFPYWTAGDVLLVNGDCLKVLPLIEAGSVDCVVTDPPYGVGKAAWDTGFPVEWYGYVRNLCETSFTMPGNSSLPSCIAMVGEDYRDVFVLWLSNGMTLGPLTFGNWIPVVVAQKTRRHLGHQNHLRVVVDSSERIDHPSPKPLSAMTQLVVTHTKECDTILDPFAGSFTTGVACVRTGRAFIGIEIERKYYETGIKRITDEFDRLRLFEPAPPVQRSLI